MAKTIKTPNEITSVSVIFTLATGETLAAENLTVTVYDWEDNDVTTTLLVADSESVSGSTASARVQAGTDGEKYKVVFLAELTNHTYEEVHYLIVTDILKQYKS